MAAAQEQNQLPAQELEGPEAEHSRQSLSSSLSSLSNSLLQPQQEGHWTEEYENLVSGWYQECLQASRDHHFMSVLNSCLYVALSIPAALSPVVAAQLLKYGVIGTATNEAITVVTGVVGGVLASVNLSRRAQRHSEAEAAAVKLGQELDIELRKQRGSRQSSLLFIVAKMYTLENIANKAPSTTGASLCRRLLCCRKNQYSDRSLL